jgi:hypothetical protein
MKTIPEVLATINEKLAYHKKEIDKVIEQLTALKGKGVPVNSEMKHELVMYTMMIGEHKGIINVLTELYKEIQQ